MADAALNVAATSSEPRSDETRAILALLVPVLLAVVAWVGAGVIWGLGGVIVGADVATAVMMVIIIRLTLG
jgi:hypothetical protein